MKNSLRTRLLVIFALLSLTIVLTTVWLTRIAFERGFVSYLDQQSLAQLASTATVLAAHYDEQGSWDALRGNPGLFRQLVEIRRGPVSGPFDRLQREQFDPRDFQEGFPQTEIVSQVVQDFALDGGVGGPGGADISLLSSTGEWIGGRGDIPADAATDWLRAPVESGDEVVGYLLRSPTEDIHEELDQSFVSSQLRSSVLIAILTLAFSLPLALYIAARLLAPVKSLAYGVQKLTRGDYGTNIEIESKDELGQLARDFNILANTLRSNQTAQQRWISDISHELRTPVAILEGEIFAILDGIRQPNIKEMKSLAAEIERLGRLINDLHQLSKSDAGDLNYRMAPIDISAVVKQSLQSFERRMEEVSLDCSLKVELEDAWVFGDESRLIQLFGNLLENSCRYTDAPGTIQIKILGDQNNVQVVLDDSSPGVTDQELPQLFDRLYRVELSRNRSSGGSGLGLSICQNIAQAHGANLEVDHSELGGLKLTCTFPRYDRKRGEA